MDFINQKCRRFDTTDLIFSNQINFNTFGEQNDINIPNYEDSFYQIPNLIEKLLTQNDINTLGVLNSILKYSAKRVVLCVLDGFGISNLMKVSSHPIFEKHRDIYQISTMFPSTTATLLSSLAFGGTCLTHGIIETNFYLPSLDRVVIPFQDKFYDKKNLSSEIDFDLFTHKTLFQILKDCNVESLVVTSDRIIGSRASYGFRNLDKEGKELTPYFCYHQRKFTSIVENWPTILNLPWQYCQVYFSELDSVSHLEGPESNKAIECSYRLLSTIEQMFDSSIKNDILFLITADHGQITVNTQDNEKTIILSEDLPELLNLLLSHRDKSLGHIEATGGARNLFLHVNPNHLKEATTLINSKYSNKLEAFETSELINLGVFGPLKSMEFIERIGNLTIIPKSNFCVYLNPEFRKSTLGQHGGLSAEELLIPLIVLKH